MPVVLCKVHYDWNEHWEGLIFIGFKYVQEVVVFEEAHSSVSNLQVDTSNALDNALRKALMKFYPSLIDVKLEDFKVRVLDGRDGTAAKVRVLIESSDGDGRWGTIGVSTNIIEAAWLALIDSLKYKLMKENDKKAPLPEAAQRK